MSLWDDHYDALYAQFGQAATLFMDGFEVSVTAIAKIAGASIDPPGTAVEVQTIRPAADVRMSELAGNGIERADLKGGTIEVAGATWRIETTLPRPSPEGEANGEVRLVLIEV
jgi:hypothetical protein